MHAFRTYILPKFKQAAARSLCDSWASCSIHFSMGLTTAQRYCAACDLFCTE